MADDNIETTAEWVEDDVGDSSRKRGRPDDDESSSSIQNSSDAATAANANIPANGNSIGAVPSDPDRSSSNQTIRRKIQKLVPVNDVVSTTSSSPLVTVSRTESSPIVSEFLTHFYYTQYRSNAAYKPPDNAYKQLPGPLPISLTRSKLRSIENERYWVCEKSDGERCIMFISASRRAAYFIDRKCQVQRITDDALYVHLYTKNGGDTIVDGEVIGGGGNSVGGSQLTYMIFDVILINGERYAELKLEPRLTGLHEHIKKPIEQSDSADDKWKRPINIMLKRFCRKHHVDRDIFPHIKQLISPPLSFSSSSPPSHSPFFPEYVYNDGKRNNKNDGLIFTADQDDYYNKRIPLYKWKWPALNTIDFVVREPFYDDERRLRLYANATILRDTNNDLPAQYASGSGGGGGTGGGGGRDVSVTGDCFIRSTSLDPFSASLIAEIQKRRIHRAVVECGYGLEAGAWHLKNVRWDKSTANFITTVQSTMESIVDNVGRKDIVAACTKNK